MGERVAVIGGRDYEDLAQVEEFIETLSPDTTVVSGAARGVDSRAAARARKRGLAVDEFPVTAEEWREIGPAAGHRRNERMLRTVNRVAAFWDGYSKGTGGAIAFARDVLKIPVEIFKPRALPMSRGEIALVIVPELRRVYAAAQSTGFKPSPEFVRFCKWLAAGKLDLTELPDPGDSQG